MDLGTSLHLRYAQGEATCIMSVMQNQARASAARNLCACLRQVSITDLHASHNGGVGKRRHLQEANISLLFPHPSHIKQKLGHGHVLAIYHLQDELSWAVGGTRGRASGMRVA